ncbi:hypothetical protein [Rhodococcus phenolicus]|uniref:hypothetical protein n=1 Tax=Rhodococcus phenolicus TaxID=263849 RepID=UPI000835B83E|nr:hypothetical protein [Rhodococcus phenolicus]
MNDHLDDAYATLVVRMALRAVVEDARAVLADADRDTLTEVVVQLVTATVDGAVETLGRDAARAVLADALEAAYLDAHAALPDAEEPPLAS